MSNFIINPFGNFGSGAPTTDKLLIETGDFLLLETGDKILLE